MCKAHIHAICGTSIGEEGHGSELICPNCVVDKGRVRHRSGAQESQEKQAKEMVRRSKKQLGTPEVGMTVAIPIPLYDRGKGDSKNLLGLITEVANLILCLHTKHNKMFNKTNRTY